MAVRVQSEHLPEYRAVLDGLAATGLLYPCFCTRADIAREIAAVAPAPARAGRRPIYPGTCRASAARRNAPPASRPASRIALRLDMARALTGRARTAELSRKPARAASPADPERFGDVVLARKDAPASYHLCVTHDDALQGVTLVTRGEDLKPATHLHRLLQALMGWPAPAYAHHRLLTRSQRAGGWRSATTP